MNIKNIWNHQPVTLVIQKLSEVWCFRPFFGGSVIPRLKGWFLDVIRVTGWSKGWVCPEVEIISRVMNPWDGFTQWYIYLDLPVWVPNGSEKMVSIYHPLGFKEGSLWEVLVYIYMYIYIHIYIWYYIIHIATSSKWPGLILQMEGFIKAMKGHKNGPKRGDDLKNLVYVDIYIYI